MEEQIKNEAKPKLSKQWWLCKHLDHKSIFTPLSNAFIWFGQSLRCIAFYVEMHLKLGHLHIYQLKKYHRRMTVLQFLKSPDLNTVLTYNRRLPLKESLHRRDWMTFWHSNSNIINCWNEWTHVLYSRNKALSAKHGVTGYKESNSFDGVIM